MAEKPDKLPVVGGQSPDDDDSENTLQIKFSWKGRLTKKNVAAALAALTAIIAFIASAARILMELWK